MYIASISFKSEGKGSRCSFAICVLFSGKDGDFAKIFDDDVNPCNVDGLLKHEVIEV